MLFYLHKIYDSNLYIERFICMMLYYENTTDNTIDDGAWF